MGVVVGEGGGVSLYEGERCIDYKMCFQGNLLHFIKYGIKSVNRGNLGTTLFTTISKLWLNLVDVFFPPFD